MYWKPGVQRPLTRRDNTFSNFTHTHTNVHLFFLINLFEIPIYKNINADNWHVTEKGNVVIKTITIHVGLFQCTALKARLISLEMFYCVT